MKKYFLAFILVSCLTSCAATKDYLHASAMRENPSYRLSVMNKDVNKEAYRRCSNYGLEGRELAMCVDEQSDKLRYMNAQAVAATRSSEFNCTSSDNGNGYSHTSCR